MGPVGWYIAGALCGAASLGLALLAGAVIATANRRDCCPHPEAEHTPR